MNELIILEGITKEELLHCIRQAVEQVFDNKIHQFIEDASKHKKITYLSRVEAAALLKVSLPTLNILTKEGVLKATKIGARVLYNSDFIEIYNAEKATWFRKRNRR